MPYKNKADLYSYQTKRWKQRKTDAIAQLGGACCKCGYNKCEAALEFHHVDPSTKELEWTKMRLLGAVKLQEELGKCILLCANCHRELHHG